MARLPRNRVVNYKEPAIYHCTQRCVRRAFLCGEDKYTNKNYDHRREWIHDRMELLAGVYAFNVLNYAVLSNHFHMTVRSEPRTAKRWSSSEVIRRWWRIHPERDRQGRPLELTEEKLAQLRKDKRLVRKLRRRLQSLSWLMKDLAEWVARKSNREDEVTGRFWQGRYSCKKIEDEAALLACAVYVDLNPLRAGLVIKPEDWQFTSLHDRIQGYLQSSRGEQGSGGRSPDGWLCPVWIDPQMTPEQREAPSRSGRRASDVGYLEITFPQYLSLLDWTGRQVRKEDAGAIPEDLPPIFERLGLVEARWVELVSEFGRWFHRVVGTPATLRRCAQENGQRWMQGIGPSRQAFVDRPDSSASTAEV